MGYGTRGRRRLARRWAASGIAGVLVALALVACGARAQVGTAGGESGSDGVSANAPGFLFECQASCADGLSCIDGTCTLACDRDSECEAFAVQADCVQNSEGRASGVCAVPCGSDDGCAGLGPGAYCTGSFCVAARLERLPSRFDVLTLGRTLNYAEVASDTECDPTVQVANIELRRGSRRLTVSTCEHVPGGSSYTVERTRRTLGDAELDLVEDAYRAVRIQEEAGCDGGEDTFTLDVQPSTGPLLRFADDDRAICRGPSEPHTSAVVGLEDLYEILLRLGAGD